MKQVPVSTCAECERNRLDSDRVPAAKHAQGDCKVLEDGGAWVNCDGLTKPNLFKGTPMQRGYSCPRFGP